MCLLFLQQILLEAPQFLLPFPKGVKHIQAVYRAEFTYLFNILPFSQSEIQGCSRCGFQNNNNCNNNKKIVLKTLNKLSWFKKSTKQFKSI